MGNASTTQHLPSVRPNQSEMPKVKGEMWGIAAYFNPAQYLDMSKRVSRFSQMVREQGLKLLIVEMAFGDKAFALEEDIADALIRIRSSCILWQKERLLNIALKHLPQTCNKVVWLDTDIVFGNDAWVYQTAELLETFSVVQPFDVAWYLPRGVTSVPQGLRADEFEVITHGMAYTLRQTNEQNIARGHSGFAWAWRREILDIHGFYDRFIVGGGDLAMAWAIYELIPQLDRETWLDKYCSRAQIEDFLQWRNAIHLDLQGGASFTPGTVYHWWHGSFADRGYGDRMMILKDLNFDPRSDITIDKTGSWIWNSDKTALHSRVRNYFWSRREGKIQV